MSRHKRIWRKIKIISAVNLSPPEKSRGSTKMLAVTSQVASSSCINNIILYFSLYFPDIFHPINVFFYLLPGCSHSWAQQPFHQFFLQHDGIHPKLLRHWQTKIATSLRTLKNTPAGNGKKQICVSVPKLSLTPSSCLCSSNMEILFLLFCLFWFPFLSFFLALFPFFFPLPYSSPTLPVQTGTEEFSLRGRETQRGSKREVAIWERKQARDGRS